MRHANPHASPSTAAPPSMIRRGPRRSTSMPTTGDSTPCMTDEIENAAAVAPRDQPNSSTSATKNTGNEKYRPEALASVTHTVPTTAQLPRAIMPAESGPGAVMVGTGYGPSPPHGTRP